MPNITVTANGNAIDMEALRLKNEKSVAVGNMKVNARGDEISPTTGEVTRTRNQRMTDYYKLHSTVPTKRQRNQTVEQTATSAELDNTTSVETKTTKTTIKTTNTDSEE